MHILNKIKLPSIRGRKEKILVLVLTGALLFILLFLLFLTPLNKTIALKEHEWKKLRSQLIDGEKKLNAASI